MAPTSPQASPGAVAARPRLAGFRTRLVVTMMIVVVGITVLSLYFAQRNLAEDVQDDLEREFRFEREALHAVREMRHVAIADRRRALVRRPRIVAALEDDVSLLYPNAEDEFRDVRKRPDDPLADEATDALRAQFYRFLRHDGTVIAPGADRAGRSAGLLSAAEERQLALRTAPDKLHFGYLARDAAVDGSTVSETIAMPIFSSIDGTVLGALVLGFRPVELGDGRLNGIWADGRLHSASLSPAAVAAISAVLPRAGAAPARLGPVRLEIAGTPHLLFARPLNAGSLFPLAYEVSVFPLAELVERQRQLRWQVVGAGALLLALGWGASHVASGRLSAPVEKLAVDSERSARFSADASHQLKTPVAVLRAGLEELLARDHLTPEECHQLSALVHQTYRLSSLIEDLLLLSRLDAGRLRLESAAVDLTALIEAAVDDLGAVPDERAVAIETDFPPHLHILGEKRYTAMILQNLLENARKYNRPHGRVRVAAVAEGEAVRLRVGNTGQPIAAAAQARIFERFHRGAIGEDVPGYGLGLNLARELARLHGGDLRLLRSADDWTEFEVRFRAAPAAVLA